MINSKRQMFIIIGAFILTLMLGTTTYAFFNYTRTGSANVVKVGRIYFNSNQTRTINLTNVFPIDKNDVDMDTNNVDEVVITITGDTIYNEGVEYLLKAIDVQNTFNNKKLPISINVSGSDGVGTLDTNYYDNRGGDDAIYRIVSDETINNGDELVVGYIPKGSTGVNGTVTIKAYLDKDKIAISDTYPSGIKRVLNTNMTSEEMNNCVTYFETNYYYYFNSNNVTGESFCTGSGKWFNKTFQEQLDNNGFSSNALEYLIANNIVIVLGENGTTNEWLDGRTLFTTEEWNSLNSNGLSFKIKVEANEGLWVGDPRVIANLIEKSGSKSYIGSYDDIIANNPGYSTQDTIGENTNKKTVYYYTGSEAATKSNVLFGGFCWQIIRTTDNGGVRLIYNGVAQDNKCETTRTVTKGVMGYSATDRSMSSATVFGRSYDYNLETGVFTIEDSIGLPTSWNSNTYQELIGTYSCLSDSTTCSNIYYVGSPSIYYEGYATVLGYSIRNTDSYSLVGRSSFNSIQDYMSMVGYMFNEYYRPLHDEKTEEFFATATWNSNDSVYELSGGNGGTTLDATHHYICDTDCTKVRYYYDDGYYDYYVLLENGETIDDVIYKMTGNGSAATKTKNADYQLNKYDSAIKGYLENWYKKNLNSYTSYLDNNAVYCNDRSIMDYGGWNSNGTSISRLKFKNYNYDNNYDLNCENETDRFSVENSKAKLKYSIGLLTEPERTLAARSIAISGTSYWGGSAKELEYNQSITTSGDNTGGDIENSRAVRPVITFKPGTRLESGTGTYTDPYVVGPIVDRNN